MVSIGVLQLSLWQRVHFWSPSRDRSACANADSEPKSTETLAQIRKSRISLRIFFLRIGNLGPCCLHFEPCTWAIRAVLNFATNKQRECAAHPQRELGRTSRNNSASS